MRGRMIVLAAMLAGSVPAQAQQQLSEGRMELYSEMWAMAGVCSQFPQFDIGEQALAERLNSTLASLAPEQQQGLAERRERKLHTIAVEQERLQSMDPGRNRDEARDAAVAALLTRCQRLATSAEAQEFFMRRPV